MKRRQMNHPRNRHSSSSLLRLADLINPQAEREHLMKKGGDLSVDDIRLINEIDLLAPELDPVPLRNFRSTQNDPRESSVDPVLVNREIATSELLTGKKSPTTYPKPRHISSQFYSTISDAIEASPFERSNFPQADPKLNLGDTSTNSMRGQIEGKTTNVTSLRNVDYTGSDKRERRGGNSLEKYAVPEKSLAPERDQLNETDQESAQNRYTPEQQKQNCQRARDNLDRYNTVTLPPLYRKRDAKQLEINRKKSRREELVQKAVDSVKTAGAKKKIEILLGGGKLGKGKNKNKRPKPDDIDKQIPSQDSEAEDVIPFPYDLGYIRATVIKLDGEISKLQAELNEIKRQITMYETNRDASADYVTSNCNSRNEVS